MGIGFGGLLGPARNGEGFVAKFSEVLCVVRSGFNGLRTRDRRWWGRNQMLPHRTTVHGHLNLNKKKKLSELKMDYIIIVIK
jgi:hypothetical protein